MYSLIKKYYIRYIINKRRSMCPHFIIVNDLHVVNDKNGVRTVSTRCRICQKKFISDHGLALLSMAKYCRYVKSNEKSLQYLLKPNAWITINKAIKLNVS